MYRQVETLTRRSVRYVPGSDGSRCGCGSVRCVLTVSPSDFGGGVQLFNNQHFTHNARSY